jgi:hypothetical protein
MNIIWWNKFIQGPLTCRRIRFSSFNQKTRYNGSLNCQNRCNIGLMAFWTAVLAYVVPTWLSWPGLHLTWHWRGNLIWKLIKKEWPHMSATPKELIKKWWVLHRPHLSFTPLVFFRHGRPAAAEPGMTSRTRMPGSCAWTGIPTVSAWT